MSEIEVVFLSEPQVGQRARALRGGAPMTTSPVASVRADAGFPVRYHLRTQSGSCYYGYMQQPSPGATVYAPPPNLQYPNVQAPGSFGPPQAPRPIKKGLFARLGIPSGCGIGCLVVFLLLAVIGVFIGPSGDESTNSSAPSSSESDEPERPKQYVLVEWDTSPADYEANEFMQPDPGNTHVVISVSVTNHGYDSVSVNPYNFTLRCGGVGYSPTFAGVSRDLQSVDLGKGASTSGCIAYEVPEDSDKFDLVFDPGAFTDYNVIYE